jgi:hypothetical protein
MENGERPSIEDLEFQKSRKQKLLLKQFGATPRIGISEHPVLLGHENHYIVTANGERQDVAIFLESLVNQGILQKELRIRKVKHNDGGITYQGDKEITVFTYTKDDKLSVVDHEEDYEGFFRGSRGIMDQSLHTHTILIDPEILKEVGAKVMVQRRIGKIALPSKKIEPKSYLGYNLR